MRDVLAAEWLKVRSVRSTYSLGVALPAAVLLGSLISGLMVADWDDATPEEQARFAAADMSTIILPFALLCAAVFGGLAATSEYTTGTIRPTLTAVPRRGRVLAAKATVVGAVTLATGTVLMAVTLVVVAVLVGDRPPPISPWESPTDGVPFALAAALVLAVTALVALGVGMVIRSSAGTLVTMTVGLFVLPAAVALLPAPWGEWLPAVQLLGLAPELAGTVADPVLTPAGAAAVCGAYLVTGLGAGAVVFRSRDA